MVNTVINTHLVPVTDDTLKWAFAGEKFNSQAADNWVDILVLT